MPTEKAKRHSRNQGVNVQSEDSTSSKDTSNVHLKRNCDQDNSLNQVKYDVKTVIELMGPSTPNFDVSSVAELFEDSMYSNETEQHQVNIEQQSHIENQPITNTEDQPLTTECDQSTLPFDNTTVLDTDVSMMVDNPSVLEEGPVQRICPPPAIPVNFVYNSECMCPQMANYIHNKGLKGNQKKPEKTNLFSSFVKSFKSKKHNNIKGKGDYYTINIQKSRKNLAPKRLVFDLVDNTSTDNKNSRFPIPEEPFPCGDVMNFPLPQPGEFNKTTKNEELRSAKPHGIANDLHHIDSCNPGYTKTKRFNQRTTYTDFNGTTRVDVYYFDHGCSSYFRTTDRSPVIATEDLAERTEAYTTKFWAEIFGTFNIGCSFLISLILQFIRFFLYSILRPLTVGLIQLISDYFFKPILTTVFNAIIQPILIFFFNIVTSLRDICDPIAEALGFFLREIAGLIRAFRLVEVRTGKNETACVKKFDRKSKIFSRGKNGNYIENTV